ncbi:MAG: hypothetical protein ACP5I8_03140 [Phycisphaerae bacterium]
MGNLAGRKAASAPRTQWQQNAIVLQCAKLAIVLSVLLWVLLSCPLAAASTRRPVALWLRSGDIRLRCVPDAIRHGFSMLWGGPSPEAAFLVADPEQAEVVNRGFTRTRLTGDYTSVRRKGQGIVGRGRLCSPRGTVLSFHDRYNALGNGIFEVRRRVRVVACGSGDHGFATQFTVCADGVSSLRMEQFFAPGIWYCGNRHLPRYAIAADYGQRRIIFREDRLPSPLVMLRNPVSGETLTLLHANPTGGSFLGDQTVKNICSAKLQFGSLGVVRRQKCIGLTFLWPGSEGDTTYIGGPHRAWVGRYHPIRNGLLDRYRLVVRVGRSPSFNAAMAAALRLGWRVLHPPVYRVNLSEVYRTQVALLNHYTKNINGIEGLPFSVALPSGKVSGTSVSIGYVGKQALDAFQMIQYGLWRHRPNILRKGRAMIDFWVRRSPIPGSSGLFRTWFGRFPKPQWKNYPTYLRIASDGAMGVLLAYQAGAKAGDIRRSWLAFCVHFAQWLQKEQHADGSFDREFSIRTGAVINPSRSSTLDPVHFLVDLFRITGNKQYLQMAVRAAAYGVRAFVHDSQFYGGTVDSHNVQDKEAGTIALGAYLSLYNATGDHRWLRAAVAAANYSATWIVAWNRPMDAGDLHCSFPPRRSTVGLSLISVGLSAVDTYMSLCWLDYYRLWLDTHDAFFKQVAMVLAYDTKQTMDIHGSPAYGFPGLQDEATSIAVYRGNSVCHWLPWVTANQLQPITECFNIFKTFSLEKLAAIPLSRQEALQRSYEMGIVAKMPAPQ